MANKLFLVCATFAFFFLLTNASIYRTTVEFDEDDTTNPIGPKGPQQRCRREFQQEQQLRACQQWIRKQAMRPRGPSMDDDEIDFEDDIDENTHGGSQQRHPILQQCCQELHQEDPQCVCPTLRQAAQAVRFQGQQQHGPMQTRRIFQTAKHLPNICNIPQVSVCPFRAVPFVPSYY